MVRSKIAVVMLLCMSLLLLSIFPVSASVIADIPIIREIDIPENLSFSISDYCSGHAYFMQAAADRTGSFIVYSRHVDIDNIGNTDFQKVYIDIYKPDGVFLQEISLITPLDCAVSLNGGFIEIYFYKSVLIYNISTQEIHSYEIPDGAAVESGLFSRLREKTFTSGEWTYSYKKGFNGFTGLVRHNNSEEQVLIEMVGTEKMLWNLYIPSGLLAIVIVFLVLFFKANRHKSTSK